MKKAGRNIILPVLFIILMAAGFSFSVLHIRALVSVGGSQVLRAVRGDCTVEEIHSAFEDYYNSLYSGQTWSRDAFSLILRTLDKHEARNFEVLKANDGTLYLQDAGLDTDIASLENIADTCELLHHETSNYGGFFLYVQSPYKNAGQAPELVDYAADMTEERADCLVDLIKAREIPVIDLREYAECREYYRTDHHWTAGAAFNAAEIIAAETERNGGAVLTGHAYYGDMDNYEKTTYDNCFLGSIGIKVGQYFAGKDDFTVYIPGFDTDLILEHYINSECRFRYTGTFAETFIDQKILDDGSYNNKYDANMHGAYVEAVIKNHLAQNDLKALLIADSYGRAMAQYMCLDYSELRYLDPQEGRYTGDLAAYIRGYKPDVVIFMFNG